MVQLADRTISAKRLRPCEEVRVHQSILGSGAPVPRSKLSRGTAIAAGAVIMSIVGGCATPRTILPNLTERQVPVDQAFVSLGPGTPAPLSIVQRDYQNAARQTIVLATQGKTPGENSLRVDVVGVSNSDINREAKLPDVSLKEADLVTEAQQALPDVPLRTSLSFVQNRYGPFGYAIGKSSQGDECIYAWQRLATPDRELSLVNSRDSLSIRLRLCEPRLSEARLAAVMMGLNVNVSLSGGAFTGESRPLRPEVGAPGSIMGPPEVLSASANPIAPQQTPPRRRAINAKPHKTAAAPSVREPPQLSPPPGSVIVPPPPLASNSVAPTSVPTVPPPGSAETKP
jgi:Cellulose biosynthesis protein BcsN